MRRRNFLIRPDRATPSLPAHLFAQRVASYRALYPARDIIRVNLLSARPIGARDIAPPVIWRDVAFPHLLLALKERAASGLPQRGELGRLVDFGGNWSYLLHYRAYKWGIAPSGNCLHQSNAARTFLHFRRGGLGGRVSQSSPARRESEGCVIGYLGFALPLK